MKKVTKSAIFVFLDYVWQNICNQEIARSCHQKITLKKFEKAWNELFLGSVAGKVSEQAYNYMV